jgi:hypothetical protein
MNHDQVCKPTLFQKNLMSFVVLLHLNSLPFFIVAEQPFLTVGRHLSVAQILVVIEDLHERIETLRARNMLSVDPRA